jgi:hypothetical protein
MTRYWSAMNERGALGVTMPLAASMRVQVQADEPRRVAPVGAAAASAGRHRRFDRGTCQRPRGFGHLEFGHDDARLPELFQAARGLFDQGSWHQPMSRQESHGHQPHDEHADQAGRRPVELDHASALGRRSDSRQATSR